MIRSYFAIAWRNLIRHKLHSAISIGGLGLGLACAILILLFVRDELSWDSWLPGADRLWRVEVTIHLPGQSDMVMAQAPMPLPLTMRDNLPEVRSVTRLVIEGMTMTRGDNQFSESVGAVDPNFLQVIQFPLLKGDPRTALARPDSIVISEAIARKYFGDADPVGKTLTTGRGGCGEDTACANTTVILQVTGVMRDLPHNSQIPVEILVPIGSLADRMDPDDRTNWLSTNGSFGYLTLAPGAAHEEILSKLKPVLDRSVDVSRFTNARILGSAILEPRLTPFLKVHMTSDSYRGTMAAAGDWTTLFGLIVIGAVILLVAGFNFMNLATARATVRAREISLRKTVGARRGQLVAQFLGEAVLMALIALAAAFALVEVLLPSYTSFLGRPLTFDYLADWRLTLTMVGIAMSAGLLSGLYPALVLSGFRPAVTLRASSPGQAGSGRLRAALVLLQFAVSIALGIAALTVFRQIDFVRQVDLGFQRDNIVVTSTGGRLSREGVESFIQALEKDPGIVAVTQSSMTPFNYGNDVLPTQKPGEAQFLSPNHFSVAPNYFSFYGIEILAGRALSDKRADDVFHDSAGTEGGGKNEGQNVMVNASLAKALGYAPADIVGKTFIFGKAHMTVVGVAADILFDGARRSVAQTVYVHAPGRRHALSIRIRPERTQEAMAHIERTSRSFIPNVALSRTFLSDRYERQFQGDTRQGQIFAIFVAIAILIACLGLFGLAALVAGRRTREIGIRKVFGARNRDVILLLLWQFSIPVLLANLIAWPLAWFYLQNWLEGFAYRIELNPLYFAGAGLAALLIAWATVFTHAWRVARASPIHALRYE